MRTQFTVDGLNRLKRDAKVLRREKSLTSIQALDHLAQREGWLNWALLVKNALPSDVNTSLELTYQPFQPGHRGVFLLKVAIRDAKILASLDDRGWPSFELPDMPARWIIRRFTELHERQPDPFLDRQQDKLQGLFVKGKFLCILSTNGVQPDHVEAEIAAQLPSICAQIRGAATEALEARLQGSVEAAQVRLFFSRPGVNGIDAVEALTFDSVEEARNAKLPTGAQPIGIPVAEGWWTFQSPFGWQAPSR